MKECIALMQVFNAYASEVCSWFDDFFLLSSLTVQVVLTKLEVLLITVKIRSKLPLPR